ncbi:hypothetical protein Trydic_g22484 [Trypoxylus dichotomus]
MKLREPQQQLGRDYQFTHQRGYIENWLVRLHEHKEIDQPIEPVTPFSPEAQLGPSHDRRLFEDTDIDFGNMFNESMKVVSDEIDKGDKVYMCTSLITLHVDMLGFYIDNAELPMLFGDCKVLEAKVSVIPQELRRAFDIGTTLTGIATNARCSVGCSGIDKPTILIALSHIGNDICLEILYDDSGMTTDAIPMSLGVPRYASMYFIPKNNANSSPTG